MRRIPARMEYTPLIEAKNPRVIAALIHGIARWRETI